MGLRLAGPGVQGKIATREPCRMTPADPMRRVLTDGMNNNSLPRRGLSIHAKIAIFPIKSEVNSAFHEWPLCRASVQSRVGAV